MPTYSIQGPDGKEYSIDGPPGATRDQVIRAIQARLAQQQQPQPVAAPVAEKPAPETGFVAGFRSSVERGKGDIAAGKAAILGTPGAEEEAAAYRKRASEIYQQPELTDKPIDYVTGLLGQSLPYMAAPIAAGAAAVYGAPALGLGALGTTVAGLGAATATSAGQFTMSNISRQLEENIPAKDVNVAKAVVAAIPMAALDTVALRYIPGIRGIFGKAGIELTEAQAAQIVRDGIIGTTVNAVKAYGPSVVKSSIAEGFTEAGQAVFERAQAGLNITDPAARKEYFDNFIGGAVLGGTLAPAGRFIERGQAQDKFAAEAQTKKEGEARVAAEAETARRKTPAYLLDELDATFTALQQQKLAAKEERDLLTGGKNKLPKGATAEQKEQYDELTQKLKETEKLLYKIGPEYNKNKDAITAAKRDRKVEGMTREEYALYGEEGAPAEAAVAPEAERTLLDIPEDQQAQKQTPIESAEGAQARADAMLKPLNTWRETNDGLFDPAEAEQHAVRTLLQNPALAERMVAERIPVPGFDSKASNRILMMLKGQVKAAPETKMSEEKAALQRMGERTRGPQVFEKSAEELNNLFDELGRNIKESEDTQAAAEQDKRVNDILNKLVDELKAKQTEAAVPSDVPLGGGAIQRTEIDTRAEDAQELARMIERYRIMSRQKGAARNDAEMADLLEEIRIMSQPRGEEVITGEEGEAPQRSKYIQEIDRLSAEQEASFRPAVEAVYQLNEYRKQQPPGTLINPQRVAAEKAARDRFVNAVLQEIEANRRAASKPSVTEDEAKTIAGRINNLLTEAGTRSFGAPEKAQEVLREQIDEIRREASVAGERKFQKAPDEGFKLTPQYSAVEEKKVPTELGERRTAVAGRMNTILADEKIKLDEKSRAVLADATRMVEDGSGSTGLVEMLEEAARRYETGANIDRTERDLFSPTINVPEGKKLQTTARPEQRTVTTETQNADLVPAIEKELQLVRTSVSEDTGQGELFSPEAGEGRVRELKRQRDAIQKRIAGRKGKKITVGEFAQHRADIKKEKRLVDEIVTEEKAVRALAKEEKARPETERMSLATTRSTPAKFQAYLRSAAVERMRTKKETQTAIEEEKKQTADLGRALGIVDAHLTQMKKRMGELANDVQKLRKIAERSGKNSTGYKNAQKVIDDKLTQIAAEQEKVQGYYDTVRQYSAQQAVSESALLKIVDDFKKQRTELVSKMERLMVENTVSKEAAAQATVETETRKATKTGVEYQVTTQKNAPPIWTFETGPDQKKRRVPKNAAAKAAITKYKAALKELDKAIANIFEVFNTNINATQGLINKYNSKISAVENFESDTSELSSYLSEYASRNAPVKAALAEAKNYREVLSTLQEQRNKFATQIANEKRAAEAIARSKEDETAAERTKASQRAAEQKTGLNLPGVRVARSDLAVAINSAETKLDEAKEELDRLKEERKTAKGAQATGLTKQIKTLATVEIRQLEADLKELQNQKAGTTETLGMKREIQKPVPRARAAKAGEKFEGTFDEFKLSKTRAEGDLPYMATRTLQPPELKVGAVKTEAQIAASKRKTQKAFEEGIASERGEAPTSRLELIRQVSDRFNAKNKKLLSRGKVKNPSTKASLVTELASAFTPGTNIEKRVELYNSVDDFVKDNPEYEGVIPADAKGFVNTDDNPYGDSRSNRETPRIVLFAKNIEKGQALGVLLHELGVHVGFRNFFSAKEFNSLVKVVESWAKRTDDSIEARIGRAAVDRVKAAKTPAADRADELLAYAVEEAISMGIDPTALKGGRPVTNWLKRLVDAFKNALKVLGIKPDAINAQHLVDFAYGAANLEIRGAWHGSDANFDAFSREKAGQGEGAFDTRFDSDTLGPGPYVSPDRGTGKAYSEAVPFGKAAMTTGYGNRTYADYRALDSVFGGDTVEGGTSFDDLTEEQHRARAESQLLNAYLRGVGNGEGINSDNDSAKRFIKQYKENMERGVSKATGVKKTVYERAARAAATLSTKNIIPLKEEPKPGTLYRTIDDLPDDQVYKVNSYIKPGVDAKLDALVKKYGNAQDAAYREGYPANALFYDIRKKLGGTGAANALEKAGFLAIERATDAGRHLERAYLGVTPEIMAKNILPIGMPTEETSFGTRETVPKILFSRTAKPDPSTPASITDAVNKIVASPQTTMDRVRSESTGIGARTMFIDRLAPMERVAEYLKKSSQAMQMLYYGRIHDQRMSLTGEVVNNGAPTLEQDEKGNYVIKSRGGANLMDISKEFAAIKGHGNAEAVRNLFTAWLAAKRAKNMGIGKAKLNFSENVTQAELDQIEALGDKIPQFEKARKLYNSYNAGLMDWLKVSGAIDEKTFKELTSMEDYIPYYRTKGDSVIMEIAGIQPFRIGNLQQQPYLKELVGGDEKIQDFFTSSLQNTSMLVDMGLRNLATKEVAFSLQEAGLLKGKENKYGEMRYMFKGDGPSLPNVIRFKKNGMDYHAIVESDAIGVPSELLVKGLQGTPTVLGGVTKLMAVPARWLRAMVTRSPVYMLRQLLRDSTTNYMLAGGDMIPIVSASAELVKMYAGKSKTEKVLQERGIIGGQILSGTSEDMQKLMLQLSKGGTGWEMALAKLDRASMKSDAAARITLYNSYRNQGLSDMEATLATLESMNFSKRGASGSLYAMNMMIPFLNAQIQGLDVLYKAFTGKLPYAEKTKAQRKLYTRGLMVAGMTLAYAAMMQDDPAYKNADMRDRLANWFIRIPGVDEPIRIPIPFEAGLIFKALPEAMLLLNDKDRDVSEVLKGLGQLTAMSVPFGPSSVPQAVKPILEASINKSFFTGKDIESVREMELEPGERTRDKTSGVAKLLGSTLNVSPIKIDHFVNGYAGGLGLAIMQAAGSMIPLKAGPEAPEKRLSELPVVGSMFQPNDAPGQITLFYEKAKEYQQAKNTYEKMVDEGRIEEAIDYAKEYAKKIAMSDVSDSFKQTMNDFTEMEKLIKASDLSGAEKLARLKEIRGAKIEFARSFNAAARQQ